MSVESLVAELNRRVPFLRASVDVTDETGWISCAEICTDLGTLAGLIDRAVASAGTRDAAVATSFFVQGYAFRVGGIALAGLALDLGIPRVTPAATAIRFERGWVTSVGFREHELDAGDATSLAKELLGEHLEPFVRAVHRAGTIGERLLWGNVAASCAAAFRAVEGTGNADRVRATGAEFFAAASPWLDGLGRFVLVDGAAREGWFWERTSCCLWYRVSDGRYCADCSLLAPGERIEQWRHQLDEVGS